MPDDKEVTGALATAQPSADVPQFSTAEYAHIPGTERCRICAYPVTGEYFRVNSQMACGKCAAQARDGQPADSHVAFLRGLLVGAGAAVVSLVLYATFTIVTNFYIGFMSLAVGWLVAKAIMRGSHGIGGRRYQIAAVLLTYFAISLAEIPIWIASSMKDSSPKVGQTQSAPGNGAESSSATDAASNAPESSPRGKPNLANVLVQLVFLGLASPFMELRDPVHGVIGLVILFVGLRIAYRMTAAKPLEVDGPYPVRT
jgi:hypothetical protein